MIKLTTQTSSGSTTHYVAPDNICRITEAGISSQWHGIRSIVKLFDGTTLECDEHAEVINAAIKKSRREV